jgi:hypothetical protein
VAITAKRFSRPLVLAILGLGIAASTVFTHRGGCAPVGGYDGPSGIRYVILDWGSIGIAYGNGCEVRYAPIPLGIGLTLIAVAGILFWDRR